MENFESSGCARRARRLCGASHWGGDLRAGEEVRERAGVAGEARARRLSRPGDSTGLFEQQVPVKSVFAQKISTLDKRRRRYGRAGVHTENAWTQTRRQRFGVVGFRRTCRHPWARELCPSVLSVGWSVKVRWTLTMGSFTAMHVG